MSELPASAQKVQDAAAELGLEVAVREMTAPTRTVEDFRAEPGTLRDATQAIVIDVK